MNPAVPWRGVIWLAVAIAVLGVNWPVMKQGLVYTDPLWMVSLRLLTAALLAFALLGVLGRRLKPPPRGDRLATVGMGLLQMAAMIGLTTLAMQWLPAGVTTALVYTTPLWVTLIESIGARKWPTLTSGFSLLLCAGGLALILTAQQGVVGRPAAGSDLVAWPGVLCALGAALSWSLAMLLARRHPWRVQPLESLPWQLLVGVVPITALAAWQTGWPAASTWSWPALLTLAYIGPVATMLGMWGLNEASWRLPSALVASTSTLTPAIGIGASALLLGEPLTFGLMSGALLVIGGALLRVYGLRRGRG